MINTKRFFILSAIAASLSCSAQAQELTKSDTLNVQQVIASRLPENMGIGTLKARS